MLTADPRQGAMPRASRRFRAKTSIDRAEAGDFSEFPHRSKANVHRWLSISCVVLLSAAFLCIAAPVAAQTLHGKNILILYSQEREIGIYGPLDRGLRAQLQSDSTRPLQFYTEYLDLLRFPDELHQKELLEYLRIKYSSRKIDLIFTVSPLALKFLLANDNLFQDIPVVFSSVNVQSLPNFHLKRNFTGIAVKRNISDTLALALRVQPDTTHVIVPGGTSPIERSWTADLRNSLRPFESRVTFSYVNDLSMDGLLQLVGDPPPHTIVLYSPLYFYDGENHYFLSEEALDLILRSSKAPVYGTDLIYMGMGIVGGHLYDIGEVGAAAGKIGARILAGERPENIPVQTIDPNYDTFDARELSRWNISEASLPGGSIVRFRQPSFWWQYKWYVLGCAVLFLLQSLLVIALLRIARKLRQSETGLRNLSRNLINAQEVERKRIARELHDDFSQRLALLLGEIDSLAPAGRTPVLIDRARLSSLRSVVDDLTQDIHQMSHALHSSKLELLGLKVALKELCSQSSKGSPLEVEFHADGVVDSVPADVALCLYRVAQEALNNVMKYSGAKSAKVILSNGNARVKMRIIDSGKGFDTSVTSRGLGLASMHERLRAVNGELLIVSKPGSGTELTAQVSLDPSLPQRLAG